jgi:hypothetical protein
MAGRTVAEPDALLGVTVSHYRVLEKLAGAGHGRGAQGGEPSACTAQVAEVGLLINKAFICNVL